MLNKKTYIRLLALVMALMMTVAVFAGCNNQEAIDEANANAQAAQNAADEAKKAADSLAQAAKDLADQLSAAQDKINEQDQAIKDAQAEASKAQDAANNAQNGVDSWHDPANTTAPAVTEPAISQKPWDEYTESANLKAFTDLKNKYLILIADWYTAENYAALNKIFEDAAFEIYRAVDGTGLEQIINDAATKAAQVDSIASDAAKVQALIAAFGDVPTEIFTTNEDKVIAAREAFDAWVVKYEKCFFIKNGFEFNRDENGKIISGLYKGVIEERRIVDFAKQITNNALDINVNTNTNSLIYAEAKLDALYQYAEDAIKAEMAAQLTISGGFAKADDKNDKKGAFDPQGKPIANGINDAIDDIIEILFDENETQVTVNKKIEEYKVVLDIVDKFGVTYAQCKANGKMIQDAYYAYRIFWNANGGDDTPISGAAGAELLTGEEFVKLYVLTLYNGELNLYENSVRDYLYNKVVEFFLNSENKSAINDETKWAKYLTYYAGYTTTYAADGSEVVSINTPYTFAVEWNRIDVYADGKKVESMPADGVQIEKDFNRVAATAATKIFALDYDKDFKGNKSLTDAYIAIDQYIVEAIAELTQVYYDDVVAPYICYKLSEKEAALKDVYGYASNKNPNARIDAYYKTFDNAFFANTQKLIALAKASALSYKTATYAELNAIANDEKGILNIADQKMFVVHFDDQETLENIKRDTPISLYSAGDAAMETILAYFSETMKTVCTDIQTRYFDLNSAKDFHEYKIDVAEKLDTLVGIATISDKNELTYTYPLLVHEDPDAEMTAGAEGFLMKEYKGKVKGVLDEVDEKAYSDALVYKAISDARDAARDVIMGTEFMNYDDATVLFTFDAYQATNKDNKALYYNTSKEIKTDAKDNKALNIIVDRQVVAYNTLVELFADGADSVLKAFADLVRPQIKARVTTAIDLYKTNYDFGGLDHVDQNGVYLEKDMQEFCDYLDSLTGIAAIDKFSTVNFSLVNKTVAAAKLDDLTGYVKQAIENDFLFHVDKFDKELSVITGIGTVTTTTTDVKNNNGNGKDDRFKDDTLTAVYNSVSDDNAWYDKMAKAQLDAFFALTSTSAYEGLEDVRELAYLKDNIINGTVDTKIDGITYQPMPVRLASFKGYKDANGNLTGIRTGYEYDLSANRTALYLQRLQETYDSICADIEAITILSVKYEGSEQLKKGALDAAEDAIEAILRQSLNSEVVYDAADDKSLAIVYTRYYLVGQYDWVLYNKNISK